MKFYTDLDEEEWAARFGCPCGWIPLRWGYPRVLMEEMKAHQMMHANFPQTVVLASVSPGPVEKGPDTFEADIPKDPGDDEDSVIASVVIDQPIGSGGGLTSAEAEEMMRRRTAWGKE